MKILVQLKVPVLRRLGAQTELSTVQSKPHGLNDVHANLNSLSNHSSLKAPSSNLYVVSQTSARNVVQPLDK